jgi:hypothetical protein
MDHLMRNTRSTIIQSRPPDWFAKLTRTLALKDGTKLVTLADAHGCLIQHFKPATYSLRVGRGVLRAIELVMVAAETGAFADRTAATDQVEIVLRWRSLLNADAKAPND